MAQEQDKDRAGGFASGIRDSFRRMGALASFIVINGFVIATITFVILYHEVGSARDTEVRSLTRGVISAAEQSLSETEKTVRALGYFYATTEAADSARKILGGEIRIDALLWATEKGIYRNESFAGAALQGMDALPAGWPSFQELFREAYDMHPNDIAYWGRMPWPAFKMDAARAAEQPVGIVTKVKMNDGTTGILLAVTTPARIFGNIWTVRHDGISRVTVTDRDSGELLFDNAAPDLKGADGAFFGTVPAAYALQLGNKSWDVRFRVMPSAMAQLLTLSPWAALLLILLLTVVSTMLAERKHRQDRRLAEMSKTLEGAHHELQTKTSERDRLFHALRRSEREYKAVINSVSDVIFETDETGRLIFLNETWKRVTDSETAEYIGRVLFDIFAPIDRLKQQEMFDELVRGERQAYRTETVLDLGRGRGRSVEVAFSMLRMTEEKSIRVVGTITDIEKRRRAELAMREAEQRFRAIFENSVSGIYQTSPEGRFISANPALAEILGYDSTEDLMLSVADIGQQVYVRPEERQVFAQKLMFEGRVSGLETEVLRKDGRRIWIMENARVVRTPKGGIQYYEGSIWDVTERKAADEAMRHARLQAEMSSRSRMEFLANMSHELRTPLNAIIGFSEIIKGEVMGPIGVPAYKEYAQDVFDSGNYLLKVISEILEVSKIETGNRELNQNNFRIPRALKSCMTIMGSRIGQSGVDVKIDLAEDLPEIVAEELAFKQIMLNLVGNAIKFTPKGGHVAVTARVTETGEMEIDVTDTGIGMTEPEIAKAMQPFAKIDNNFSTMKEGTGLGLTIVDSLVRLHGGVFRLISEKGKGTTARVTLPAFRVLNMSNVTPLKTSK